MTEKKRVKVSFEIEHFVKDGNLAIRISNVDFDNWNVNPMIVAFGTMNFLEKLTEEKPPEYYIQSSDAKRLYDYIQHFAKYMEAENLIKPPSK